MRSKVASRLDEPQKENGTGDALLPPVKKAIQSLLIALIAVRAAQAAPLASKELRIDYFEDIEGEFPIGQSLGGGMHKQVFAVTGQPDRVIALGQAGGLGDIFHEAEMLLYLQSQGIPTVKLHAVGYTSDGRAALVLDRWEIGSKDGDIDPRFSFFLDKKKKKKQERLSRLFANKKVSSEKQRIEKLLRKKGIVIKDLQYLLRSAEIVIHDPINITPAAGTHIRSLDSYLRRPRPRASGRRRARGPKAR
jgi:hypothetical protein